jgi:hypothetical protein
LLIIGCHIIWCGLLWSNAAGEPQPRKPRT